MEFQESNNFNDFPQNLTLNRMAFNKYQQSYLSSGQDDNLTQKIFGKVIIKDALVIILLLDYLL